MGMNRETTPPRHPHGQRHSGDHPHGHGRGHGLYPVGMINDIETKSQDGTFCDVVCGQGRFATPPPNPSSNPACPFQNPNNDAASLLVALEISHLVFLVTIP